MAPVVKQFQYQAVQVGFSCARQTSFDVHFRCCKFGVFPRWRVRHDLWVSLYEIIENRVQGHQILLQTRHSLLTVARIRSRGQKEEIPLVLHSNEGAIILGRVPQKMAASGL